MKNEIPQTILMTTDTAGGVWTYSMELCSALARNQINVHLATMGEPLDEHQRKEAEKQSNIEIHESNFALEWMDNPWKEVDKAGEWLLELEQKIQPDLIHLNNYTHGDLPWQNPVVMIGHSCVLSWWEAVENEPAPEKWDEYKKRVKKGLQQADVVVGVSDAMIDSLQKFYGPFSETEVIYNGRSSEQFSPKEKMPIIFSMGRMWDEAKNLATLNEIADSLFWPVYTAGDSDLDDDSTTVQHLGKISPPKAAECLARAGIYVMPARYEPFGLSILEAGLSECALVLGDIPSLREIWGEAALFVNPDDPKELQKQIQGLIQNPSELKDMAQKAREKAQNYSTEIFEKRYIELYRKMLGMNKKHISPKRQTKTKSLSV